MSPFEPPLRVCLYKDIIFVFIYSCLQCFIYLCNRAVTTLKTSRKCWHVLCSSSLPCRFVLLHIGSSPLNADNAICKFPFIAEYCITKFSLGKNKRQFICCNIWLCYNSPSHINNRKIHLLLPSWLYFLNSESLKCSTWLFNYRSVQACLADRMSVTFLMFKKINCSIFWVTNLFSKLHVHILKSNRRANLSNRINECNYAETCELWN